MNLTFAIPAHNDQNDLCRLLARVQQLKIAAHVVVVDDGSDVPVSAESLLEISGLPADHLTLLRHDTALGPGAARNRALQHVATDHMLFMDADDLPTRELGHLLCDLDGQDFDFCMFQHHDTRLEREHSWGQTAHDQTLWQAAKVDVGALTPVAPAAATQLARTANYPWNKIYRTGFLCDHRIGCSEIMVHEDIELHWRSFLKARPEMGRILASDRIAMIHMFHEHGARLTNRTGPERLAVFEPLERISAEIDSDMGHLGHFARPFHRFTIGLFDWIWHNLDPALRPQFTALVQRFRHAHIPPALLDDITRTDPALVARVLDHLVSDRPADT
ncbi:MAG: glycosyl transferase [Rhodobacteraceae bacterium]|nr:MAG: glycosyl transferase [Paracoccaceae bacterium]